MTFCALSSAKGMDIKMKYGLYQYLMIALRIVGILIIIYVVRLIIKALRKYTKSAPVRKSRKCEDSWRSVKTASSRA